MLKRPLLYEPSGNREWSSRDCDVRLLAIVRILYRIGLLKEYFNPRCGFNMLGYLEAYSLMLYL